MNANETRAEFQAAAESDVETVYSVTTTVIINLDGLPIKHTRQEIFAALLARLEAGNEDDIDKIEVVDRSDWLTDHQQLDPHCTCNDCIADHEANLTK